MPTDMGDPHPAAGSAAERNSLAWLAAGAALSAAVAFVPAVAALPLAARATAAVTALTGWCWISGALPMGVASLLPAFLLPCAGVASAADVAASYFRDILLLFLGGFLLALALERHGLHERFALGALRLFGARPRRLILGFMVAAAALSLFVNNTSTALLMLPVAQALLSAAAPAAAAPVARPLLLGLAYSCSIGGVGTPIGTAPNQIFLGQLRERFPAAPEVSFGLWVLGMLPYAAVFLLCAWLVLTRILARLPQAPLLPEEELAARWRALGPRRPAQNRVLALFGAVVGLWMTRLPVHVGSARFPGWSDLLPQAVASSVTDATVALAGAILLFVVPAAGSGRALLGPEDFRRVPWEVLLLMGGGFALAHAFEASGLDRAVGEALQEALAGRSPLVAVAVTTAVVTMLTEITSNTATITLLLPLLFSGAVGAGMDPLLLAVPATVAVSNAFMLPAGTPPNAIVFATGRLRIAEMASAGLLLNALTVVLVTAFTLLWIAPLWGVELRGFPAWAR